MTNTIVVGVDGSECSKKALQWAAAIAEPMNANIEAVTYWSVPAGAAGWSYFPDHFEPDIDAEKVLTAAVDDVFGADRPAGLILIVQEGDAARGLVKSSERAHMLVVGSRGHGGFASLLLGSVSAKCVEHASCPVLVIHGDTPAPSFG